MHTPRLAMRSVTAIAVSLLLTGAAAGIAPATLAAAARTRSSSRASLTISGTLNGVAATWARNAWAVGSASTGPLIVRWNGAAWRRVPSPGPANRNDGALLTSVTAASAASAWAAGGSATGKTLNPALERPGLEMTCG